jgi:diaminopimelate decarboxylase
MTHFAYQNNVLHAEQISLDTLATEHGTPLYVYSASTLIDNYRAYRDGLTGVNARICYAMKANDSLAVLDVLIKEGAGVDVVSGGEIAIALKAGANPAHIVFSGVGKTADEMEYALKQGIFQFNVESEPELDALQEVAARLNIKAPIALRVNPDVDPKTHAKISTGQKETKFGIGMDHAIAVYKRAAAMSHIIVQGVSVHIGSQLTTLEPYREAYIRVRDFVEVLRDEAQITLNVIDLGGGLGISYNAEVPPTQAAYGTLVKEIFAGFNGTFLLEPGRSLVGKAGVLVTKTLYVKQGEARTHVIVDAGLTELIRPAMYEAYHAIDPVKKSDAAVQPVDIVGPVCETGDIFASQREIALPQQGDLLVLRDAGAYGMVMASTYNARPLVAEVMVKGNQAKLVRTRQTIDDLTKDQIIPDWN